MALRVRFTWSAPHPRFAADGAAHGGWWADGPLAWNYDDPDATGGPAQWEADREAATVELETVGEVLELVFATVGALDSLGSLEDLYGADAVDADGTILCAHLVDWAPAELEELERLLELEGVR